MHDFMLRVQRCFLNASDICRTLFKLRTIKGKDGGFGGGWQFVPAEK